MFHLKTNIRSAGGFEHRCDGFRLLRQERMIPSTIDRADTFEQQTNN
jgi:hypothetical protein